MENCLPPKCSCVGHTRPGISHLVACCDQPHMQEPESPIPFLNYLASGIVPKKE